MGYLVQWTATLLSQNIQGNSRSSPIPMALVAGSIVFVLALVMEVRHYRQNKTLSAIERMG